MGPRKNRLQVLPLALATLAVGVIAASCQPPTQLTITITTNAKCHEELKATAIYVGGSLEAANDKVQKSGPVAQTDTCTDGKIGTLVVTPGHSEGALVVIGGFYGKQPTECVEGHYENCIIARRSFTFIKETPLDITIPLERNCLNVPCDVHSTCHDGQCYSAGITCSSNGKCTNPEDGDAGPVDGGARLYPDGQPEPLTDGSTLPDGAIVLPDGAVILPDSGPSDSGSDVQVIAPIDAASDGGLVTSCQDPGDTNLYIQACGGFLTCIFGDACCAIAGGPMLCHSGPDCVAGNAPIIQCCDHADCPGSTCCVGGNMKVSMASPAHFSSLKPGCAPTVRLPGTSPGTCQ